LNVRESRKPPIVQRRIVHLTLHALASKDSPEGPKQCPKCLTKRSRSRLENRKKKKASSFLSWRQADAEYKKQNHYLAYSPTIQRYEKRGFLWALDEERIKSRQSAMQGSARKSMGADVFRKPSTDLRHKKQTRTKKGLSGNFA